MHTSVWPILNNEQTSGVTIHKIDRGIDTGDICAQEKFKILPTDRSHDLYRKYISTSCNLLTKHLDDILNNRFHSTKQSCENSSYYSANLINFSQLTIDLNCTAWQLKRKVYAFSFRSINSLLYIMKKL
jgi:methionyl-tRNA formyltransferase